MKIYCQICEELIATAESSSLRVPTHGSMFGAPYPERMAVGLLQSTEWEFLRCPVCRNRPFLRNDEVMTENGIYRIPPEAETETEQDKFYCDCCDPPKEFDTEYKRDQHMSAILRWRNKKK